MKEGDPTGGGMVYSQTIRIKISSGVPGKRDKKNDAVNQISTRFFLLWCVCGVVVTYVG